MYSCKDKNKNKNVIQSLYISDFTFSNAKKALSAVFYTADRAFVNTDGKWLFNLYYATETVSFKPSGCIIFKTVSRLGMVLKDSILATEDCGIPQIDASSL